MGRYNEGRFRACSVTMVPEMQALLSVRMFVLTAVNCWEDFAKDLGINSILQEVLRSRGEGNLKLKPEQNEVPQTIVLNDQDCLIVLPTSETTLHVIYQTRGRLFIIYPNTEIWVEKTRRSRVFFNQLQCVWISDETFFRVFSKH